MYKQLILHTSDDWRHSCTALMWHSYTHAVILSSIATGLSGYDVYFLLDLFSLTGSSTLNSGSLLKIRVDLCQYTKGVIPQHYIYFC